MPYIFIIYPLLDHIDQALGSEIIKFRGSFQVNIRKDIPVDPSASMVICNIPFLYL